MPRVPKQNEIIFQSLFAFNDPLTLHDLRRTHVSYLSASRVPAAEVDRFIGKRVSQSAAACAGIMDKLDAVRQLLCWRFQGAQ